MDKNKSIEVTPEMVKAGIDAWGKESNFYGPPDVDGEDVVIAIYLAMTSVCAATSEVDSESDQ